MYLVQKAFYSWLLLFFALLVVNRCSKQQSDEVFLPMTTPIVSITVADGVTLRRQDENTPWYVDARLAKQSKVTDLMRLLQQPCRAKYNVKSMSEIKGRQPLKVKLNGDAFVFGAHQELSQTHYVQYQDDVYLCLETIKYILSQPPDYWLAKE